MKIRAEISYPTTVEIEVPENATHDEIREQLFEQADLFLEQGSVQPIIVVCTIAELEE